MGFDWWLELRSFVRGTIWAFYSGDVGGCPAGQSLSWPSIWQQYCLAIKPDISTESSLQWTGFGFFGSFWSDRYLE